MKQTAFSLRRKLIIKTVITTELNRSAFVRNLQAEKGH